MKFPLSHTLFIAIFGFLLLYSYYFFSQKFPNIIESLWGSIKGNIRKFYFISIFFCFIAFGFIFFYIFQKNNFTSLQIIQFTTALAIIIFSSLLWMPTSILYFYNKSLFLKLLIILILLLVSMGALYLIMILQSWKETNKNMMTYQNYAFYGACYFFFQVFILDFIFWNYAYLYSS